MLTSAASAAAAPLARVCYLSFRAKKRGELSYSVVILSRVIDCSAAELASPCARHQRTPAPAPGTDRLRPAASVIHALR